MWVPHAHQTEQDYLIWLGRRSIYVQLGGFRISRHARRYLGFYKGSRLTVQTLLNRGGLFELVSKAKIVSAPSCTNKEHCILPILINKYTLSIKFHILIIHCFCMEETPPRRWVYTIT